MRLLAHPVAGSDKCEVLRMSGLSDDMEGIVSGE